MIVLYNSCGRGDNREKEKKMTKAIGCLTKAIGSFLKKGHAVVVLPTGAIKPTAFNAEAVVQLSPPYSPARVAQRMGRCLRAAKPSAAPQAKRTLKKSGRGKLWTKDEVYLVALARDRNRTKKGLSNVAKVLGRSYNSVTAKASNLDARDHNCKSKGFKNGGPFDKDVMQEFLTNNKAFSKKAGAVAKKLGIVFPKKKK